jgi:hypothetical protein
MADKSCRRRLLPEREELFPVSGLIDRKKFSPLEPFASTGF